jgi:hypothetical protein
VSPGFLLEQEPPPSRPRTRRVDWLELRLTALRLRLLALTRLGRLVRGRDPRPLRGSDRLVTVGGDVPAHAGVATLPVARLDAGRRERMLWRVHDASRAAHRDWESGADPAPAMRDLAASLARIAEFDVH